MGANARQSSSRRVSSLVSDGGTSSLPLPFLMIVRNSARRDLKGSRSFIVYTPLSFM